MAFALTSASSFLPCWSSPVTPSVPNSHMEVWAEINPFLPRLPLVLVFCHSTRNAIQDRILGAIILSSAHPDRTGWRRRPWRIGGKCPARQLSRGRGHGLVSRQFSSAHTSLELIWMDSPFILQWHSFLLSLMQTHSKLPFFFMGWTILSPGLHTQVGPFSQHIYLLPFIIPRSVTK